MKEVHLLAQAYIENINEPSYLINFDFLPTRILF